MATRKTISQRIALIGADKIKDQLAQFGEAGEKAFKDVQDAAEKMKGPGAEFARSMDKAQKRIEELGKKMTETGEKMRNWGAGASLVVTAPVTMLAKSFLDAASNAEEAGSAFNFLFAEAAKGVEEWAQTTARELGRGRYAIMDQVAAFQMLFGQVAPTHEAAVQLSQDFTVLAQDLASFYNMTEQDALDKLRAGLAGETEPLRAFGVFLNEATIKAKGLEMGLSGLNDELTDQEKVLVRAQIVMEKTTTAQGDAARTIGSYANQLKAFGGVWQDLSVTIGRILLPVALQMVQALGAIVSTIEQLPRPVQTTIVVFAGLAAAIGPILLGLGAAAMGFGMLSTGVASFVASGGILAPFLASVATAFGGVAAAMRTVMALAAPMLGWPVVLAAAIGALAVTLYLRWDEIVAYTAETFVSLEEIIGGTWENITSTLEAAVETMTGIFSGFRDRVGQFFDQIGDRISAKFDWIKNVIGDVLDWAESKLSSIVNMLGGVSGGGGGSEARGYASGGRVRGPGTATSDSILARLSDGEYVVRARAVQHYGPQLFNMLNRMMLPRTVLRRAEGGLIGALGALPRALEGFASGGMVGALPAYAGGGAAQGGEYATLNLSIGGEMFSGLMAPRDTADRLIRFAMNEEVKSAGRRPGWFRGS